MARSRYREAIGIQEYIKTKDRKKEQEITGLQKRLANKAYTSNAPEQIVTQTKNQLSTLLEENELLQTQYKQLSK